MITVILLKYWKHIAVASAIVIAVSSGYHYIYDRGYQAATQHHQKKLDEYIQQLDKKIASVEELTTLLAEDSVKKNAELSKDLTKILAGINGKTLVVYKDGKCTLAPEFLDSYNSLILKGNSK